MMLEFHVMNNTVTLHLTREQEDELLHQFETAQSITPPYARFCLRLSDCTITCYESGKTVFQGKGAEKAAAPFMTGSKQMSPSILAEESFPQAGSDEVGTGDYFGPVCVCAALVRKEDLPLLQELGVRDSKQVDDGLIRKAGPVLLKKIPHSLLVVSPRKYNEVHDRFNMNAIKALLHNQAYVNLSSKAALPRLCVVDQFAPEPVYYSYLKNEPVVIRGLHFETKSEDKYPAVASASILARYAFLIKMDEMEQKYQMSFHKGAGTDVDRCGREFVKAYGQEALADVAKLHFRNTDRILNH